MVYGTLAAVAENDLETFTESIEAIQRTVWKTAEWSWHGEQLKEVAAELRTAGARGVGMSSMGPSLYFDATHLEPTKLPPKIFEATFITRPANLGRSLKGGRG
ncbi:beta-ribofuranosylaminobenzene 5'-phosphate synthase [Rhizobium sp. CCGE 510]|nr:beta-ribofuranosylaminobenzene 5'-phosphate synthase [Rhizobium sp. CCGE 510]